LFCRRRELEPFRRVTEANRQAEENLVLDFLLHLVRNAHKSPSSARQYLGAIRNMHVSLGLPEPFADMSRVKFTMEGFKKRDKGKERRRPFTPAMLRWVWRNSRPRESQDDAAIWFALCLGYFYLLRSREYTHCEGHTALGNKGLRGADVTWRKNGETVLNIATADELVIVIRSSKTQQNMEATLNQFRSGDPELCVVQAAEIYYSHAPERMAGSRACDPLLALQDGTLLTREHVQKTMRRAAIAAGVPPESIGSHSLRIGGATALWATFKDAAMIKRWGRWASETWQSYVWPARESAKGVATAMAAADITLV